LKELKAHVEGAQSFKTSTSKYVDMHQNHGIGEK